VDGGLQGTLLGVGFLYDSVGQGDPIKRDEGGCIHMLDQTPYRCHGGLLVVTSLVDAKGSSVPFLTLIAAPSVAMFNKTTGDLGVILVDI
jgi:hypothetical protein